MKLITIQYVPILSDTIFRYPYNSDPEEAFDATHVHQIQTYQIRSINEKNGMLELVMSDATQPLFAMPGDIIRIFVNVRHLAEQKVWWLNDER